MRALILTLPLIWFALFQCNSESPSPGSSKKTTKENLKQKNDDKPAIACQANQNIKDGVCQPKNNCTSNSANNNCHKTREGDSTDEPIADYKTEPNSNNNNSNEAVSPDNPYAPPPPPETPKSFDFVSLGYSFTNYTTFSSHFQKIVVNKNGIFLSNATELHTQENGYKAHWKILRSTDGGASFQDFYNSAERSKLPALELDLEGNILAVNSSSFIKFTNSDHQNPLKVPLTDGLGYGKYSATFDKSRNRLYFCDYDGKFYRINPSDGSHDYVQVTSHGTEARLHYPYLSMDGETVYLGWTTTPSSGGSDYREIRYIFSEDGGNSWQAASEGNVAAQLTLPIITDEHGPAPMVNLAEELGSVIVWNADMLAFDSKVHFMYMGQWSPSIQRYMRMNPQNNEREAYHSPHFGGENLSIYSNSSFFVMDKRHGKKGRLFAVGKNPGQQNIVVIASNDQGSTWYDYGISNSGIYQNSGWNLTGHREITADGYILGMFTHNAPAEEVVGDKSYQSQFFKLNVDD